MYQPLTAFAYELKRVAILVYIEPLHQLITIGQHDVIAKHFGIAVLLSSHDLVYKLLRIIDDVATNGIIRCTLCPVNSWF